MSKDFVAQAADVAASLGLPAIPSDWAGCDLVWGLLERIRDDGAVFVLALDRQSGLDEPGGYTVVVSEGPLASNPLSIQAHSLEAGLGQAIVGYARRHWDLLPGNELAGPSASISPGRALEPHAAERIALVPAVAAHLGLPEIPRGWRGCDVVWPLLERMRDEGANVLIKLDGERGPRDNGPYTVRVLGGRLAGGFVRVDSHTLEAGLAHVIVGYASACWGFSSASDRGLT